MSLAQVPPLIFPASGLYQRPLEAMHPANILAGAYAAYNTSVVIPFSNNNENKVPFTTDIRVNITVNGRGYRTPIVDTGTCGLLLPASKVTGYEEAKARNDPRGWEYLSSSHILYSGYWVSTEIVFNAAVPKVTATVPVLAVDYRVTCHTYNSTTDTDKCTKVQGTATSTAKSEATTEVQYIGIGFGRQHDGQPQGNPDKNVMLNVKTLGNQNVTDATYRNGYIISKEGITVGLTAENTKNMQFSQLTKRKGRTDPRDWNQVQGCFTIGDNPCSRGVLLVDTGVAQMYMTVPTSIEPNVTNPTEKHLVPGSKVHVAVGAEGEPFIATSDFVVSQSTTTEKEGVEPNYVKASMSDTIPPKVNTGRHFLRKWKIAFDAVDGRFGAVDI
ncbi:hypothetical protein VHEMI02424 [[Torrubiella] hemipterigena]|uniref:Peptidase A1 domain-containing protein n=1 Tax=[Torrubiella] hemipterigena TaxID=1531966 RepID=A0A0A1TAE9_9HYPO|nr:hypothetical protein VHEMI02424 [[Torrubiella] hemipterigena]